MIPKMGPVFGKIMRKNEWMEQALLDVLHPASRAAVIRPLVGRLPGGESARSARDAVCAAGCRNWYLLRESNPGSRGVSAELWPLS